jgi:hypothetical protein
MTFLYVSIVPLYSVMFVFGYTANKGTRIHLEFTAGNLLEPAAMLGHKTTIWSPSHNAMHVIITYQSTTTHGIW